ncbi:uncharacterized protein LOC119672434 [Teleopsis dalmanni]|uniref:uncharacterized protein LOC119672434 n=1 Tax=Teleopsis dalmanni TaxID=139649 RepID=UPI0018CF935C|nr:uncharacterized protein LOC119672434 [Teleopsis dalmanni]
MEDALTRQAIQEIISETYEESTQSCTKQRPSVKPNKEFLGRTISSIVSHNKRESAMQQRRCRDKLRELDRKSNVEFKRNEYKRKYYRNRYEQESSSSSESEYERHKRKKRRKKSKKKSKVHKHKSSRQLYKLDTEECGLAENNYRNAFDAEVCDISEQQFSLNSFALEQMKQHYIYQHLLGSENSRLVQDAEWKDADLISVADTSSSSPVLSVSSLNSEISVKQNVPTINLLTDNESEESASDVRNINNVNDATSPPINLSSDEFDLSDSSVLYVSSEHSPLNIISLETDSNSNCGSQK